MTYKSALPSWNVNGNRVFLRIDCNVPLEQSKIIDDLRLKESLATINYLIKHKAKIVLAGHIGRPSGFDPALSTRILIPWFEQHGYSIEFEADLDKAARKSKTDFSTILLLENLRFFSGEKDDDPFFAQKLKELADLYVNDAFGILHRTDCSVYALPQLFLINQRSFGLLIQKELNQADNLFCHGKPFTLIVGGGKLKIKFLLLCIFCHKLIIFYYALPLIKNLKKRAIMLQLFTIRAIIWWAAALLLVHLW